MQEFIHTNSFNFNYLVERFLLEDLSPEGDVTTDLIFSDYEKHTVNVVARSAGIFSGLNYASQIFTDTFKVQIKTDLQTGERYQAEQVLATLTGSTRELLRKERLFLNILQRSISISTYTRQFVDAIADHHCRLLNTRKTTPGLRDLERSAFVAGGGYNHRHNLSSAILIKDNHIALAGGNIRQIVHQVLLKKSHLLAIEVEVDNLNQLKQIIDLPLNAILLDNFTPQQVEEAVGISNGRVLLEASGGITLNNVSAYAATGVNFISVGCITSYPPAVDIGLDCK